MAVIRMALVAAAAVVIATVAGSKVFPVAANGCAGCIGNSDCTWASTNQDCIMCDRAFGKEQGTCIVSTDYCGTPCDNAMQCAPVNKTGACTICDQTHRSQDQDHGRCRPAPSSCGTTCATSYDCAADCMACIDGTCAKSDGACGAACKYDDECSKLGGPCGQCVRGKCIRAECGSTCDSVSDCIAPGNSCVRCAGGTCAPPSNESLKCGADCGNYQGKCTGSCTKCAFVNVGSHYCVDPNINPGCGQWCGAKSCPTSQGDCTYCSGTCTTWEEAKRQGLVRPEHRHLVNRATAPEGSHLPWSNSQAAKP